MFLPNFPPNTKQFTLHSGHSRGAAIWRDCTLYAMLPLSAAIPGTAVVQRDALF